jgi:hypothetical protein
MIISFSYIYRGEGDKEDHWGKIEGKGLENGKKNKDGKGLRRIDKGKIMGRV